MSLMTVFSIPKMEFEDTQNVKKVAIDCYPFRAHYIKLYRTRFDGSRYATSDWMLEHVECIRKDMVEYIDLIEHAHRQEGIYPRSDNG